MSCRQAFQIDIVGFLADPSARIHEAFRAHYPGCRDCSAEVRAWTELHLALHSGALPFEHPPEELLLRWEEEPGRLAPSERRAVDAHLEHCASCSDELASLRGLLRRVAAEQPQAPGWLARFAERLRVLLLHPAFAYALVGLLLIPALASVLGDLNLLGAPAPMSRDVAQLAAEEPARTARPTEESETRELVAGVVRQDRPAAVVPAGEGRARAYELRTAPKPDRAAARRGLASAGALAESQVRPSDEREASNKEVAPRALADAIAKTEPEALDRFAQSLDAEDLAASREATAAEEPPPPASSVVLLSRSAPADVERPPAGQEVALHVPVPRRAPRGSGIRLRVIGPRGERELVEQREIPLAVKPLELRLSSEWLEPGAYQLELRYREPRTEDDTVENLRFRVFPTRGPR